MDPNQIDNEAAGGEDAEFDRVANLFSALDKVIRGMKLYQGEGVLVERMTNDLVNKAEGATKGGPVTVRVASFGLVYQGHALAPDEKRNPYLFRMFCDGIRELTMMEGIQREELDALVEVLATDDKDTDEDLVTMLWKKQLKHIRYYAADTFTAGMQVDREGELTLSGARSAVQMGGQQDGESITLSPDDIRMLGGEGQLEWVQEVKAPSRAAGKVAQVAERICQAFETPKDLPRFMGFAMQHAARSGSEDGDVEPSALALGMLDDLMGMGKAAQVALALGSVLEGPQAQTAAAEALLEAIAEPDRLKRLAQLMNREPGPLLQALEGLVKRLGPKLVSLLTELSPGEAQEALHKHLETSGVDLTAFYAEKLRDPDEAVVIHAVQSLGLLGNPEAVKALASVLSLNSTTLRKAALEAMIGKYHPDARVGLGRSLKDPSQENRLLALKVLQTSGDSRVTWALLSSVKESKFGQKDSEEQAAFYRALASFQDDRTVSHFQEILSRKNLMRGKGTTALQLLAVRALAEVGTEKALETLGQFRSRFYHPAEVKSAIQQALAGAKRGSQ